MTRPCAASPERFARTRPTPLAVAGLSALFAWAATPAAHGQALGAPADHEARRVESQPSTTQPATQAAATVAPAAPPDATPPVPLLPAPLLGEYQDRAAAVALVGTWSNDAPAAPIRLTLRDDGGFSLGSAGGAYSVRGDQLHLRPEGGAPVSYQFDLGPNGDALTLKGGDLRKETKFTRQADLLAYLGGLLDVSPAALRNKAKRIGTVVLIVVATRLVILLLQGISYVLVTYDWGPLRLVYRGNKRRIRTLHSMVLNIVKYVIYFMALGFILSEMGINYTTYIASLSVVGLAIGFGSQGLVQDMVTGFFVIFEDQFDVGDMVDISGQTGVVTDLGLRMTKLRNYLGQEVVIPNRNIAVVGNYRQGAQQAVIDVAVGEDAIERGSQVLERVGGELQRQFSHAVLGRPEAEGPLRLTTGERFLRLTLPIWPGQTWVVDTQFVPRIREAFKAAGIEVPSDRVVAFYRQREQQQVNTWRLRVQELQQRIGRLNPWGEGDAKGGEKGDTEV